MSSRSNSSQSSFQEFSAVSKPSQRDKKSSSFISVSSSQESSSNNGKKNAQEQEKGKEKWKQNINFLSLLNLPAPALKNSKTIKKTRSKSIAFDDFKNAIKEVPSAQKNNAFANVAGMLMKDKVGVDPFQTNSLSGMGKSENEKIQSNNKKIMDHLEESMNYLVKTGKDFNTYHDSTNHEFSDGSSIGSIKSADVNDMEILLNGEIEYRFQAIQKLKKINGLKKEIDMIKKNIKPSPLSSNRCLSSFLKCVNSCKSRSNCFMKMRNKWRKEREIRDLRVPKKSIKNNRSKSVSGSALALGPQRAYKKTVTKKTFNSDTESKSVSELNDLTPAKDKFKSKRSKSSKKAMKRNGSLGTPNVKKEQSLTPEKASNNKKSPFKNKSAALNRKDDDQNKSGTEDERENQSSSLKNKNISATLKKMNNTIRDKYMIPPGHKKLQYFHMVVALALYFDFFMTCFLMGNYYFMKTEDFPNFLNHIQIFNWVILIQVSDIILNFFKIQVIDVEHIIEPKEVGSNYLRGYFLIDVVSVLPYNIFAKKWVFVRLLKLIRFRTYQKYIDEFLFELFSDYLEKQQLLKSIDIFDLLIMMFFVSHFFACCWLFIGSQEHEENGNGWIHQNELSGIQQTDFWSLYITSVYWVITSFSSVGYGDVKGHTYDEYQYQIIIEMIGIGFYGYMIGTFQNLFAGIQTRDQLAEQQESLDHWLIALDKARKDELMPYEVLEGVKCFYNNRYKFDAMMIKDSEIFHQLKPRLKNKIIDEVFKMYYKIFQFVFENCEQEFTREILYNCQFRFHQNKNDEGDEINEDAEEDNELPVIMQAGKMSKYVYFILSGQVHIMNQLGLYEYGILEDGSYFGDISLLTNKPNEYSYFYNPMADKPVQVLCIKEDKFLKICDKYPLSKEILVNRAHERTKMFQIFKSCTLIKMMKSIKKNPKILTYQENITIYERVKTMKELDVKIQLLQALIKQYQLTRLYRKKMNSEYIEFLIQKETKEMLIELKNEERSDCSSDYLTNKDNNAKGQLKSQFFKSQNLSFHEDKKVGNDQALFNHKSQQEEFKQKSSKNVRQLMSNENMENDFNRFKKVKQSQEREHEKLHDKYMEKCEHGGQQLEGGDHSDNVSQFTNHRMETWRNVKFTKKVVDENGEVRSIVYQADKNTAPIPHSNVRDIQDWYEEGNKLSASLGIKNINMQESEDCESGEEDEFKNFSVSSADSNDSILAGNTDFVYQYPVKPILNNLQSIQIARYLKFNKDEVKEKLRAYFMQRTYETLFRNPDETEFMREDKTKRKPTAHIDIIIEEYLNLRQINDEIKQENKQVINKFEQSEDKFVAKEDIQSYFTLTKGATHDCDPQPELECQEIDDAEIGKIIQDETFKHFRRNHMSQFKKKLERFKKHFNERINEVEEKIRETQ